MGEEIISDLLEACYFKYHLVDLCNKIGVYYPSRSSKSDLIDIVIIENGTDNIDLILNNSYKVQLESIAYYFDLPTDQKKEDLISAIQEYIKLAYPKKSKNVAKSIVIDTKIPNGHENQSKKVESKRDFIIHNDKSSKMIDNKIPIEFVAQSKKVESKNDFTIQNDKLSKMIDNKNSKINNNKKLSIDEVLQLIKDCEIPDFNYESSEKHLQKYLERHLEKFIPKIEIQHEYYIGSTYNQRVDIDLFDESIGIEVKKMSSLERTDEFERAIGQIYLYSKKRYKSGNLIVLVIGTYQDQKSSKLFEFQRFVNELNAKFIFLEVIDTNLHKSW